MSKQIQENFIEKTRAFKTIQAYRDAATQARLNLEYPEDFPNDMAAQLDKLKNLDARGNGKMDIVVTHMFRQNARSVDEKGKPVTKEHLTYKGEARITTYDGVPHAQEFEVGRHYKPNVVSNPDQIYDQRTREPLRPEKKLSGGRIVYDSELELPKDPKKREKLILQIIGDNHPENIHFYYNELGPSNLEQKSDDSFGFDDWVHSSIEELRNVSAKTGGSRGPGYFRDRDGKLRDTDGNIV